MITVRTLSLGSTTHGRKRLTNRPDLYVDISLTFFPLHTVVITLAVTPTSIAATLWALSTGMLGKS